MLELVVSPVRNGRYAAHLGSPDGRCLVASAREPFFAAARVLLAEGIAPDTVLGMRHAGSAVPSLRSTVGAAAKLTVRENDDTGGPVLRKWEPNSFRSGAPPIEFQEGVATTLEAPT